MESYNSQATSHHARTISSGARPCIKQRSASSYANSSAFSASANSDEDWTQITDLAERRRIQNRIAQRNYRKKQRRRLEDLERRADSTSASPEPEPRNRPLARERVATHKNVRDFSPGSAPTSSPEQTRSSITSSYSTNPTAVPSYLTLPEDRFMTRSNSISSFTSFDTQGTASSSYSHSPTLSYSMPSPELPGVTDYRAYSVPKSNLGSSSYSNYVQPSLKPEYYRQEYTPYNSYGYGLVNESDTSQMIHPSQISYDESSNEYTMCELPELSEFSDLDVSDDSLSSLGNIWSFHNVAPMHPTFLVV